MTNPEKPGQTTIFIKALVASLLGLLFCMTGTVLRVQLIDQMFGEQ